MTSSAGKHEARGPALLADASWYGTLAAVRDLGMHQVPITLASDALVAPARWSRYVTRTVSCPKSKDAAGLLAWLLRFGAANPGHVLYPTSDEVAWLVASHTAELSNFYQLYSPSLDSLVKLLDKEQMVANARTAGLDTPETRVPRDESSLRRCGHELGFPLFVKPRSQVFGNGLGKGLRVQNQTELDRAWRSQRLQAKYNDLVLGRVSDLALPVLQTCASANERIYTVDGFVDESGELYDSLACVKLLQRPRGSGPGIIFEHTEIDPGIDEGLRRLFRAIGFFGVFDAEFIESDGRRLLIDINPRFYNHMAFESDRGLHLPWLAYLAATGNRDALHEAVSQAKLVTSGPCAYVHHLLTSLMLRMQSITNAMPAADRRNWRRWIADHNGAVTDPARRVDDPGPGRAEVALEVVGFLRHPRSYVRKLCRA